MIGSSKHTRRPAIACEIAADRVLAGRAADSGRMVEMASARELAPGTVVPDLMEANLHDGAALRQAIEGVLNGVGGRSRDVIAILPDSSVRVAFLDFETLPAKRDEAEAVVRFRLKKSLPFDPDNARISYHAQTTAKGVQVVAAVVLNTVLEEYESAFRDAGYNPGVVMPSMLAALGAADAQRPTLVVKVDARTIGIAILDQEQLLLFRTLENLRGVAITGDQLAEEVYPSVVFFQDTYSLNIERVYVAGLPEAGVAAPALHNQSGARVEELVAAAQIGTTTGTVPRWRMAGVVGALIS
ncbi:MAG: type IV pilus biogenesis protein PilM [Terriglobales bacterium]